LSGFIQSGRFGSGSGGAAVVDEADGVVTQLQRTTTQSINTGTFTVVPWSSAIVDSLGAFSGGSPTIVTVPSGKTGVEVTFHTGWADNSTNSRATRLYINSTVVDANYAKALDRSATVFTTRRHTVAPGDTLKVEVFQDTGGALNLFDSLDGFTPTIEFKWFA